MLDLQIFTGTLDEAVAFVVRQAMAGPVSVIADRCLGGGQVCVTASAVYVSREVHGAILGMMADPRLRPDEQQPAARLRGLEG